MDLDVFFRNKGRRGLANVGATCYINTTIQCLSYCLEFLHFVLSAKYRHDGIVEDNNLMNELRSLYIDMWLNNHSLIPRRFINSLKEKIHELEIYQQNDAHEFLCLFLEKLNRDIAYDLSVSKKNLTTEENYANTPLDIQRYKMDLSWFDRVSKEYSELMNLFYGQSITQVICGHCRNITHNHELYSIILLPFDDTCSSLHECLKTYFKDEILNEDVVWTCDECKQRTISKKTFRLWRNPKIIIFTLKRFTYDLQKNTKRIEIPSELSMDDYTLLRTHQTYKLKSVVFHDGNYWSGHYYAMCKHPDGKWYRIDDLTVSEENNPDYSQGYMFYYSI